MAILSEYVPYLGIIFTLHATNFVQGALYGIGLSHELVCMYNITHESTLRQMKKCLVKKLRNR